MREHVNLSKGKCNLGSRHSLFLSLLNARLPQFQCRGLAKILREHPAHRSCIVRKQACIITPARDSNIGKTRVDKFGMDGVSTLMSTRSAVSPCALWLVTA